jgi:hypothetical protein
MLVLVPVGGKTARLVLLVAVVAPLAGVVFPARAEEPPSQAAASPAPAPTLPAAPAHDEAHACVAAYETAQIMQQNDHLTEAREALRFCARPVCPAIASVDCMRWLGDVERTMPSIVLQARVREREVTQVVVALDGKEILQQLDGRAVEVDPGPHHLSLTLPGQRPIETTFVARAGEKNRLVSVQLEVPETHPPTPAAGASNRRRDGWIVGGVGLVSLLVGGAFGVRAITANNASNDVCPARRCSDSSALADNGDARTAAWVSDIGIGVGLVGVAVGSYLVLTSPARTPTQTAALRLDPYVTATQSGLRLSMGW